MSSSSNGHNKRVDGQDLCTTEEMDQNFQANISGTCTEVSLTSCRDLGKIIFLNYS